MTFLLRSLYSLLFWLLLPFIYCRLWWRGRRLADYRTRWLERTGRASFGHLDQSLWVHAVSVGEVLSAVPLIRKKLLEHPNLPIVVTTMTPTGSARVREAFKNELNVSVFHSFVPYDVPSFIKRFINHIQPTLFIAMETELWPNLLRGLQKQAVPILIANARLSPRSVKRYKRLGSVMQAILQPVTCVAAQSEVDAERFIEIGMPSHKVHTVGNIKFDLSVSSKVKEDGQALKTLCKGPIWIAASTHADEEAIVLEAFTALKVRFPTLVLFLVPRHPDRFESVSALCDKTPFKVTRRSVSLPSQETDIYLCDSMGEMMLLYGASDIAFVGGSLIPVGGHNMLEPAVFKLPILSGPYLVNFKAIADLFIEQGALECVHTAHELEVAVQRLLLEPQRSSAMGEKAWHIVKNNQGALDKLSQLINTFLKP